MGYPGCVFCRVVYCRAELNNVECDTSRSQDHAKFQAPPKNISLSVLLLQQLGTIPILRQQRDWVGWVRKMAILLRFSTIYADVGWMGGWVRKSPKMC